MSVSTLDVALVTQMRAGTHYMCAALRVALEAEVWRPADNGRYVRMPDDDLINDLRPESRFAVPPARDDRKIFFSHYYHPHHDRLPAMPRVNLIGFPLDSFYSDGVVYSDERYHAGPSHTRSHAADYVFRQDSPEWRKLEERMHQNARWLMGIADNPAGITIRYEDLLIDFPACSARMERELGGFLSPLPRPAINRSRTYWTGDFAAKFDSPALRALQDIFGPSIERFYPERVEALRGCK